MEVYRSEEEQVAALKQWWHANGTLFVSVLVLTLAMVGGWRYWQRHQHNQLALASEMYQQWQVKQTNYLALDLKDKHAGTMYADFVALHQAKVAVSLKDYQSAVQSLNWVIEHTRDHAIRPLARVRLARIQLMQAKPDAALATLSHVPDADACFWCDALRGKAYLMKHNHDLAKRHLLKAQQALDAQSVAYAFDPANNDASDRAMLHGLIATDLESLNRLAHNKTESTKA